MEKIEAAKDKKSTNLSKARKNYIKDTPYLDIGIGIKQMTPSQFKKAYKGEYSQLFKYVRNTHNLLLSNKDINKKYKNGNWFGIIYKITRIKNEDGSYLSNGPIRIGKSTRLLSQRWAKYVYRSKPEYKGNKYHIHNAINKYSPDSFETEIISVCNTKREYLATEIFWTIFYNRNRSVEGYDLAINEHYNPIVGDLMERIEDKIPKTDITRCILEGFEVNEIKERYGINTYSTLNHLFEQYYEDRSLKNIRSKLIRPLLDYYVKIGLNEKEVLKQLSMSGIKFIERYDWEHELLKKYCKENFGKRFDELRIKNFIKPFLTYLTKKGIVIGNRFNKKKLGLTEYLLMEELGFTDILYLLQKCSPKDDKKTKSSEKSKLRGFLKTRWGMSYTKLRVYLRKKYFPTLLRKKYILIIKKSIFNDNKY